MILLDTNLVSEAMKPSADPVLAAWLDAQVADTIYLSAYAVATRDTGPFTAAGVPVINPWTG
jgi:predicted nucleic acid-binding protein